MVKVIKSIDKPEVHIDELKRFIMMEIGSSESIISGTLHMMIDFGFIKEIADKPFHFQIIKE